MKKTLLAAALTVGFFGVAQAETSVTLYGILDGGIGYQQIKGNTSRLATRTGATDRDFKKTGMINGIQSGNRWGVKGAEDLGNGLRAVFQLESGFDLGTGNHLQGDRLFGRQATVGLAGDAWGQFDLGRQTNIASKYFGAIDPFGLGFSQANAGTTFTSANTVRYDNMVMYQTPNFSGFQFGVGYSFNISGAQTFKDSNDDDRNTRAITTGLRYANGPIAVALAYDTFKVKGAAGAPAVAPVQIGTAGGTPVFSLGTPATAGGDDVTVKSWLLGASYDFEVVKASLAYGQTRNGYFQGNSFGGNNSFNTPAFVAADGLKINSYLVGLSAPLGNGTLMASWQMADPRSAPDAAVAGEEWDKQQIYSLGYTYGLSKRTNLYAIGSYAKHANFLPDAKSTLIGVGVRHQF